MLKSRACLIVLFSLLYGCGGGGGLIPPNPNPNPPTGYRVTVTLNMNQVYEGEEVTCTAQLPPSSVQAEVRWRQEPSSPSGTFSPLSGAVVRWRSPLVEKATSFSLIACVVIQGKSYEGSASVIVLDKSEPPQEPPRISISYPLDDGKQNLVGEGTLLTIMGNVQAGSNPIQKIQILEGSNVLQEWPAQAGNFRVDLSSFGSAGRKSLKIRVVDSAGLYSETSIPVINNDNLLEQKAREFLRKYCCSSDGGTVPFATTDIPVVVPSSLQSYWQVVTDACNFWNKYVPLLHLYPVGSTNSEYFIEILDHTDQTSNYVAETFRTYTASHQVGEAYIKIFKGWLDEPDEMKGVIVCHEVGHGILTMSHVDEFGPLFIMSSAGDAGGSERVIPPIVQQAMKLLYTHPPAWEP